VFGGLLDEWRDHLTEVEVAWNGLRWEDREIALGELGASVAAPSAFQKPSHECSTTVRHRFSGFVVLVYSTLSNSAILACFAALIGSVAREVASASRLNLQRINRTSAIG
jgi:hypothetical protein